MLIKFISKYIIYPIKHNNFRKLHQLNAYFLYLRTNLVHKYKIML